MGSSLAAGRPGILKWLPLPDCLPPPFYSTRPSCPDAALAKALYGELTALSEGYGAVEADVAAPLPFHSGSSARSLPSGASSLDVSAQKAVLYTT
jgi:hypothetical protein